MRFLKQAFREAKYPTKRFDDSEIPEGVTYVILEMDTGMYFGAWGIDRKKPAIFTAFHENAKQYGSGDGKELSDDLYALRKKYLHRVTTTNEEMNWK